MGFLQDLRIARVKEWQRADEDHATFLDRRRAARFRLKRSFLRASAALIVVLAVSAGAVFWATERRDARRSAQVAAEVAPLMRFVESARHLKFIQKVAVELLPAAQFDELPAADPTFIRNALVEVYPVFEPLGLSTGGSNPSEAARAMSRSEFGFYDWENHHLFVRGSAVTPLVRAVLVHELTHALDDQHFSLRAVAERADREGRFFPTLALIEGDARRIQDEYLKSINAFDPTYRTSSSLAARLRGTGVAPQFAELLAFPYDDGANFVRALATDGGEAAVNDAFSSPPFLDNQILHPAVYLDVEAINSIAKQINEIPEPVPTGEVLAKPSEAEVFGELILRLFLEPIIGTDRAKLVSSHWSGDAGISWYNGRANCVRIAYASTTSADRKAILEGLRAWAKVHKGAMVRSGKFIELTSCG